MSEGFWAKQEGCHKAHYLYDGTHALCTDGRPNRWVRLGDAGYTAGNQRVPRECNRCAAGMKDAVNHRAADESAGRPWGCMCLNCRRVRG